MSFLGLQTEFPILVCDFSTDAIIGTYTLGSILPHTLDIKNGLLFMEGGVSLQLHRRDAALSGRVFTVGHCSIPPYSEAVLHCTTCTVGGRSMPFSGLLEGLKVFVENTGLVVGRMLVDPSVWRVPVLVSNFGQETVMVEPFSEIGMIAQVSAIQPVMDQPSSRLVTHRCCQIIFRDCWTRHHMTWTAHRGASWRVPCCSSLICFPYRVLP